MSYLVYYVEMNSVLVHLLLRFYSNCCSFI